jgi:hypothetical protein
LVQTLMPTSCTFDKLYITARVRNAGGGGDQYAFTLSKNGVSTALTCSVTIPAPDGSTVSCADTTAAHAVSVVPTDVVSGVVERTLAVGAAPTFDVLYAVNCR